MSAEAVFASALLDHLRDDDGVLAYLGPSGRIYDRAPAGAGFPFLSLGGSQSEPIDGDNINLIDHRITLHIFGRRDDRDSIEDALGVVRSCLHEGQLTRDAPFNCILCRVVYCDIFPTRDSRTLHGLIRLKAIIET